MTDYSKLSRKELRKRISSSQPDMPDWQKSRAELQIKDSRCLFWIGLFATIAAIASVFVALFK